MISKLIFKLKSRLLKKYKLYTEDEVNKLFSKLQYEIAQYIIGNRENPIVPLEFLKEHKK